jgi:hypothetical protein
MTQAKKEVLIVVGSESDRERVAGACKALDEAKVGYECVVSSAHRNPDQTADLAKNADDRLAIEFLYAGQGLSRPFIAPPNMPADRAKMLQDAFMATMKDPEFVADATKQKLPVNPKDGAYLAALINKIYATPKPIVNRVAELIK